VEYNDFASTEEFIRDTQETLKELNEERNAHSELIQQISKV
jgi:hypothetical protein